MFKLFKKKSNKNVNNNMRTVSKENKPFDKKFLLEYILMHSNSGELSFYMDYNKITLVKIVILENGNVIKVVVKDNELVDDTIIVDEGIASKQFSLNPWKEVNYVKITDKERVGNVIGNFISLHRGAKVMVVGKECMIN